jgi:pimeloyl-ACP methyl ester carboxylesterase
LALLLALAGCAATPEGLVASTAAYQEHRVMVPIDGGRIFTRLCLPAGGATQPLVLINHGSPVSAEQRANQRVAACSSEAVRWFLARGHAVGLPLRRGYGENGGPFIEGNVCSRTDYVRSGRESARDLTAALAVLGARADVPPGPALVVGQSAGGWATVALAAENPAGVRALISMAGGRGGRGGPPGDICEPGLLVHAAGIFGRTARLPMLWVYAANDSFFDPPLAQRLHAAFTEAGGQARMEKLGPWGRDGHNLFFGNNGSLTWGPLIEDFLR